MKKIPCLFVRDFTDKRNPILLRTVTPGCEWVLDGEGVATIKRDGSACAVIGGALYKRYDAKRGKPAPANGIPCDEPDAVTGHYPHWVPVGDESESKWHREAWESCGRSLGDGTYELCGPKVSANPEGFTSHVLVAHGEPLAGNNLRTFDGLKFWLDVLPHEGIVWHHPDGRMAKLRRDDFGYSWPVRAC